MKILAYDNGGATCDRYTLIPLSRRFYPPRIDYRGARLYTALGLSENPTRGFSQFCEAQRGRHLGKKLPFRQLPEHIQRHALARLLP